GGRGTRGAVYRIWYVDGVKAATGFVTPPLPGRSLDWREGDKDLLPRARNAADLERRRALDLIWRHRTNFKPQEIEAAIHANLDREISRTLARLGDDSPKTLAKLLAHLDRDLSPEDDVHYLIVLARLTAPRPPLAARDVAATLLDLDRKITAAGLNRDRNWP